jgi:hypothetical protein
MPTLEAGSVEDLRDEMPAFWPWEARINALLTKMEMAGMAEWLPTIEEVRAALSEQE